MHLSPVKVIVGKDALGHGACVAKLRKGEITLRRVWIVRPCRVEIPDIQARDGRCTGVEEEFMGVESMPFLGTARSVHAVPVELAGPDALNPDMPHVPGPVMLGVQLNSSGRCVISGMIEELKPDASRVAAEKREIGAVALLVDA
jgi:hypothetical protein